MPQRPIEQLLTGGNVSGPLVRVGDTVRRPAGPWSASVDSLLRYLESRGFDGSPRALGYDAQGRQVLTYVAGHVDPDPSDLSDARLRDAGALLRELHDLTSGFVPGGACVWNVPIEPDTRDLICHNDVAPWNLVRGPGTLVLIDWDGAGPGSRLWDLAYAAHGFVPLSPRSGLDDERAATRLASLVDGYGAGTDQRSRLLDLLPLRIDAMCDLLDRSHRAGVEPWSSLWKAGHGAVWEADARYTRDRTQLWRQAL